MNIQLKYSENEAKEIKSVHIDGEKTCAFGEFKQAIDITVDRKEIRILDINNITSMWLDKSELLSYIDLLKQIHDQMKD